MELRINGRVVVHSPAVLVHAAPAADVAPLDDDVVCARAEEDAVNLRRPERQAAEDDMRGLDLDAVVHRAGGVNRGRARTPSVGVEDIPLGVARLVHGQRLAGRVLDDYRPGDREHLAPGGRLQLGHRPACRQLQPYLVRCAAVQRDDAAPIFADPLVEPERWCRLVPPPRCRRGDKAHPAGLVLGLAAVGRPVPEADARERSRRRLPPPTGVCHWWAWISLELLGPKHGDARQGPQSEKTAKLNAKVFRIRFLSFVVSPQAGRIGSLGVFC